MVLGESSIDFDITLTQVDVAHGVATLLVRHVPPKKPQLKLPAVWMHEPVADTPNNWVSVARNAGNYVAEVGKETFDVQLTALVQTLVELSMMDRCHDSYPRKSCSRVGILTRRS